MIEREVTDEEAQAVTELVEVITKLVSMITGLNTNDAARALTAVGAGPLIGISTRGIADAGYQAGFEAGQESTITPVIIGL